MGSEVRSSFERHQFYLETTLSDIVVALTVSGYVYSSSIYYKLSRDNRFTVASIIVLLELASIGRRPIYGGHAMPYADLDLSVMRKSDVTNFIY